MCRILQWLLSGICLVAVCTTAQALEPLLGAGVLKGFPVGQAFDEERATYQGFEMAETVPVAEGGGKEDLVRYEREDEDSLCFVEVSVKSRVVESVGWTRVLSRAEADSTAASYLGGYARALGFPDDVVADQDVHAVAWIDSPNSLRLELILQRADDEGEDWEVTAVLRRQYLKVRRILPSMYWTHLPSQTSAHRRTDPAVSSEPGLSIPIVPSACLTTWRARARCTRTRRKLHCGIFRPNPGTRGSDWGSVGSCRRGD